MKQGASPPSPPPPSPPPAMTATAKGGSKPIDKVQQSLTPSRFRASSKAPKSPEGIDGVSSIRARSVPPDLKNNSKAKRVLVVNKPKSAEESQRVREAEEAKVLGRRQAVEIFARPRRRSADFGLKRNEDDPDGKKKELLEKLELRENLIKNLQSEVLALKAELNEVKSFNVELESQNKKLSETLAAAKAKITALSNREKKETIGEHQNPKFKDIQKLIADKLERSTINKQATGEAIFVKAPFPVPKAIHAIPDGTSKGRKPPASPCAPPPPPPLPPLPPPTPPPIPYRPAAKAANSQKAPALADLFHSLRNLEEKKDSIGPEYHNRPAAVSAHNSIVGEIQNRSAHLLAIKADIATKGEFINGLIKKVVNAAYVDIEDVVKFVDWFDGELSSLADERAVLKHFNWPEKKADALREAAVEYRELKLLEQEISSYKDDPDIPCGVALKKMASLLDKSERSIQRLIKLRNSVMRSYQDYKIPTAWMLDSGIMAKIKQASMTLVKMYMKRVTLEVESIQNSDKISSQESLLLQGVHFAYRAHQFAGGLDSETLCAIEDIRQRVPAHLAGSRELIAGIPSS